MAEKKGNFLESDLIFRDFVLIRPTCSNIVIPLYLILILGAGFSHNVPADITISPAGPIIAPVGSTVKINCTRGPNYIKSNIRWRFPWPSDRQISTNKDGSVKGKFSNIWVDGHILQLVVQDVRQDDAGGYTCEMVDGTRTLSPSKTVKLHVLSANVNRSTCSLNQFRCPGNDVCIKERYRCDMRPDCANGEDEIGCPPVNCNDKFRCLSGQCVDKRYRCDILSVKHCRDGSDEWGCPHRYEYDGQIKTKNSSLPIHPQAHEGEHNSWHFNAIYSGVAAVVGLVCVIAVVVVTVCRIHMRRATLQQVLVRRNDEAESGQHLRSHHRVTRAGWQQSSPPAYDPPDMEDYPFPHRCPASASVAVNINVQFTPNTNPEFTSLLVTPPPYAEVGRTGDTEAPPPYSTLDRGKINGVRLQSQGRNATSTHTTNSASTSASSNGSSNGISQEEINLGSISQRDLETGQTDPTEENTENSESPEIPTEQHGLLSQQNTTSV